MTGETAELADLGRDLSSRLTSIFERYLNDDEEEDVRLCDEEKQELMRDACTLNYIALNSVTMNSRASSTVSDDTVTTAPAEDFQRHLRRAHAARADGFLLLARHFCGSRKEAVASWTDIAPYTLLDSPTPLDFVITATKVRGDCLQRTARMTRKCLDLCHQMTVQLREIVELKPEGMQRLDTLSCLDDQGTSDLRASVRGWIDDIGRLTEELDDTVRIPCHASGIARELLSGQKRFVYAFMDVMEGCLKQRMAQILSPSETLPENHLHLETMLDELDILTDSKCHPFLSLARLSHDDALTSKLQSLTEKFQKVETTQQETSKQQSRRPSFVESVPEKPPTLPVAPQNVHEESPSNAKSRSSPEDELDGARAAPQWHLGGAQTPTNRDGPIGFTSYRSQTPTTRTTETFHRSRTPTTRTTETFHRSTTPTIRTTETFHRSTTPTIRTTETFHRGTTPTVRTTETYMVNPYGYTNFPDIPTTFDPRHHQWVHRS